MNLLIRMFIVITKALLSKNKLRFTDESIIRLRVLPNDIDTNLHLNNGRFLTMMDLGRTDLTIRCGLHKLVIKEKIMPVAASVNIVYIKSLAPLEKFSLKTKLIYWDESWFYLEQKFVNKKGLIVASAVVKAAMKKKAKRLNPHELMLQIEPSATIPQIPTFLKEMIDADKNYFSGVKLENRALLKGN